MRIFVIFTTMLCLSALLPGCDTNPRVAQVDSPAPDFRVIDLKGKSWSPAELKGKAVFLHFWATWCPSCREELSTIGRLYAQMPREEFVILTVLYKDDPQQAQAMVSQIGGNFPITVDYEDKAARAFGLTGVPETYIIDREGIMREKIIGAVNWDSPEARQMLGQFLPQP